MEDEGIVDDIKTLEEAICEVVCSLKTILRWQILIFLSLLSILAIFQVVLVSKGQN